MFVDASKKEVAKVEVAIKRLAMNMYYLISDSAKSNRVKEAIFYAKSYRLIFQPCVDRPWI